MELESHGQCVARRLIEPVVAALEQSPSQGTREDLGEIAALATLLGDEALVARVVQVLQRTLGHSYLPGVERRHALYDESRILERIRAFAQTEEHLALCLERRYEEAFAGAKGDQHLEEIAATQAFLGDLEAAQQSARERVRPEFRQHAVLLILVVEFFRRGLQEQAMAALSELESQDALNGRWQVHRIYLANGFIGREPWSGYPYFDW